MRLYDRVSSSFFVALAFIICLESSRLGIGTLSNPGAGLVPLGCGLILGIIGIIVFTCTFKEVSKVNVPFWKQNAKRWKVVLSVILLVCYALLIDLLGFILITVLWLSISCRLVGGMDWRRTIFIAVITTFASYVLFDIILEIRFPRGIIGF